MIFTKLHTRIKVVTKKHLIQVAHIAFICVLVTGITKPPLAHAGVVTAFTDKVKALFAQDKNSNEDQQMLATTQTMALFKPVVVDDTTTSPENVPSQDQDSLQAVSGPLRVSTEDVDFPLVDTVSVYEVKKGDTIQDVAKLFNVSVNTIMWANNLTSRTITKGDTLIILPITGIKHSVKKGDTIASIARKYKADNQDVALYNGVDIEATLAVGDTIIVPDGEIQVVPTVTKTTKPSSKTKKPKILDSYANSAPADFLIRPVVGGRKTQGLHGHNGIDIAATPGTPVLASASGRVIVARMGGYNGGYGNMIIITHEKGIQTFYAHLRDIYVTSGQTVSQGQTIGEVGNTGRSTGPHLHFEVRGAKNPF